MKSQSKAVAITYWFFTALLAVMMAFSAYAYLTVDAVKQGFTHLGYPSYFRVELAVAKALGALALLIPLPAWIKEWAYAGFVITFISAVVAHLNVDGPKEAAGPVIALVVTGVSYFLFKKRTAPATAVA